MSLIRYAQDAEWYEKHDRPHLEEHLYYGFGLSRERYARVKERTATYIRDIKPEDCNFRGLKNESKEEWFARLCKLNPEINRQKVPPGWFKQAAMRIIQTAESTVNRRQVPPTTTKKRRRRSRDSSPMYGDGVDRSQRQYGYAEPEDSDGDGVNRSRRRYGYAEPEDSDGNGVNRSRRRYGYAEPEDSDGNGVNRKSRGRNRHAISEDIKGDGEHRTAKKPKHRGYLGELEDSENDNFPAQRMPRSERITPIPSIEPQQHFVQILLVQIDERSAAEPVETKDIVAFNGMPSFARLEEAIRPHISAAASIDTVIVELQSKPVHVRSDTVLIMAMEEAAVKSLPTLWVQVKTSPPQHMGSQNTTIAKGGGQQDPESNGGQQQSAGFNGGRQQSANSDSDKQQADSDKQQADSDKQQSAGFNGGRQQSANSDSDKQQSDNTDGDEPQAPVKSSRTPSVASEKDADEKSPASGEVSYQDNPLSKYQWNPEETRRLNELDNDQPSDDEAELAAEEKREELFHLLQKSINSTLSDTLARQTSTALQELSDRFGLSLKLIATSTDRIPVDRRWLLGAKVALSPHQWQLVHEMLKQEAGEEGGGIVGDEAGLGKTYPAIFKAYVNFFILRLRYQRDQDIKHGYASRHITRPASEQDDDDRCPTQDHQPLPCPCCKHSWTFNHPVPRGAALFITMPNIINTWLRMLVAMFAGAPILDDDEFPLRIAVMHGVTQTAKRRPDDEALRFTANLTQPEYAHLCRLGTPWDIPARATKKKQLLFPSGLSQPEDATASQPSAKASGFLILTTPQSLPSKLLVPTKALASWHFKGKAVGPFWQILLTLREVTLDEGHIHYSHSNQTMTSLRQLRDVQAEATGDYLRYWMLSGTSRCAGITVIANHVASVLSRPSWQTSEKEYLRRLGYTSMGNPSTQPFLKLISEWEGLQRDAQHEDAQQVASSEQFKAHVAINGEILRNFLIERKHETKRADGGPLVETADIHVRSRIIPVQYNATDVEYVHHLNGLVKAVQRQDVDDRVRTWELKGCKGARPVRKAAVFIKGYMDTILASTTPGLVRWFKENEDDVEVSGLRSNDIKKWWADPFNCPLYKHFSTIIKGDMKWQELLRILDAIDQQPKSAASEGHPSKLLIGVRAPVIALLYFCGLLRRYNQQVYYWKDTFLIRECTVTAVHSDVNLSDRIHHFDALNEDASRTRILLSPIEISAEGLPATGANFVVVVDPYPAFSRVLQLCARPCRSPQKEAVVHVTQLYHADSPVDTKVIGKQALGALLQQNVNGINMTGASRELAIEVNES